uniref:Uncharacterized protein n=1 Tax=Arundo donax TaxID=35708 RepID=A0A0A9GJZ4_ARUDO
MIQHERNNLYEQLKQRLHSGRINNNNNNNKALQSQTS